MEQENNGHPIAIVVTAVVVVLIIVVGVFMFVKKKQIAPEAVDTTAASEEVVESSVVEEEGEVSSLGAALYEEVEQVGGNLVEGLPDSNPFSGEADLLEKVYVNPFE